MGGKDRIGIETLIRGRRETATTYVRPEFRSLTHDGSGDGVVDETHCERIQSHKTREGTSSGELAA